MFSETVIDGMMQRFNQPDVIMARMQYRNGEEKQLRLCDVPSADKLEKFVEDVKFGVYPLTVFGGGKKPPHFRSRAASPERIDSVKSATPEPVDIESRRIVNMMCSVKKLRADSDDIAMTILLRMDDKMNRQLTCQVSANDSASDLTDELVRLGFVHIDDRDKIQTLLEETLQGSFVEGVATFEYGAQPLTFSATINEHGGGMSSVSVGNMGIAEFTTTTTMGGLNQSERSWSVAETDPLQQQQYFEAIAAAHAKDDAAAAAATPTAKTTPPTTTELITATTTTTTLPTTTTTMPDAQNIGSNSSNNNSFHSSNLQTAFSNNSNNSTPSPTSAFSANLEAATTDAALSAAANTSNN